MHGRLAANDMAPATGGGLAYIVQAVLTESGMGTYRGELATWHAAIESARSLRRHGFKTTITDPDGKQVDETDDECGKKLRCG